MRIKEEKQTKAMSEKDMRWNMKAKKKKKDKRAKKMQVITTKDTW